MKRSERIAAELVRAISAIEFKAQKIRATYTDEGFRMVARVEVRHPVELPDGTFRLVAVIEVDPPRIAYCTPQYRAAMDRVFAKVVTS